MQYIRCNAAQKTIVLPLVTPKPKTIRLPISLHRVGSSSCLWNLLIVDNRCKLTLWALCFQTTDTSPPNILASAFSHRCFGNIYLAHSIAISTKNPSAVSLCLVGMKLFSLQAMDSGSKQFFTGPRPDQACGSLSEGGTTYEMGQRGMNDAFHVKTLVCRWNRRRCRENGPMEGQGLFRQPE